MLKSGPDLSSGAVCVPACGRVGKRQVMKTGLCEQGGRGQGFQGCPVPGSSPAHPGDTLLHDIEHQFPHLLNPLFDYYPLSNLSFIPRTFHLLCTELCARCCQGCQWDGQGPAVLEGGERALNNRHEERHQFSRPFITGAAASFPSPGSLHTVPLCGPPSNPKLSCLSNHSPDHSVL